MQDTGTYLKVKDESRGHTDPVATGPLTRERRRQLTRDALIEAAADVFAERGFEGASLDEIAAAAGFTRGAIYANFSGKEDLYYAVNEKFNAKALAVFADLVDREGADPWDMGAVADTWWPLLNADRKVRVLGAEFNAYAARHPELRERSVAHREQTVAMVADYVASNARERGLTGYDPVLLAKVFLAVSDGVERCADLDPDAPRILETILTLLLAGIEATSTPAQHPARSDA